MFHLKKNDKFEVYSIQQKIHITASSYLIGCLLRVLQSYLLGKHIKPKFLSVQPTLRAASADSILVLNSYRLQPPRIKYGRYIDYCYL